jgi:hypothetical protein
VTLLAALCAGAEEPGAELGQGDAGWSVNRSRGGLTLEQRNVLGSSFREYRVVAEVAVDPLLAADVVWGAQRSGDIEDLKHRQILYDEPDRVVFYDQIRTVFVSDRDYVVEATRRFDAAARRTEIRLASIDHPLTPPAKGYVRMARVRAGWKVEPRSNGGTRLTLWTYTEPGGALPAWLVRGPQGEGTLANMKRMIRRLSQQGR